MEECEQARCEYDAVGIEPVVGATRWALPAIESEANKTIDL